MRVTDRYPIIVTDKLVECQEFYVRYLGFEVGFAASWFTWLTTTEGSATIAFMAPDHPSRPPGPTPYGGEGVIFEIQVDDVAAVYAELTAKGLSIEYPLTDEPFGQRRFGFHDPAGLWIDILEQTEAAPGYWDRYRVA